MVPERGRRTGRRARNVVGCEAASAVVRGFHETTKFDKRTFCRDIGDCGADIGWAWRGARAKADSDSGPGAGSGTRAKPNFAAARAGTGADANSAGRADGQAGAGANCTRWPDAKN